MRRQVFDETLQLFVQRKDFAVMSVMLHLLKVMHNVTYDAGQPVSEDRVGHVGRSGQRGRVERRLGWKE